MSSDEESDNERAPKRTKREGPLPCEKCCEFRVKLPAQSEQIAREFQPPQWSDLFSTEDGIFKLFICARTKSGKTTLLWNILKRIVSPRMKVVIFARHYERDGVWRAIIDLLEQKRVNYTAATQFKKGKMFNLVRDFLNAVNNEERNPDEKGMKYLLIFDDQGKTMRDDDMELLLQCNRQHLVGVIICSQSVTHLNPNSWGDLDFCILFKNQPEARLQKLHDAMSLALPYETFERYYRDATAEPHSFFYVGGNGLEDYRRNFTDRYKREGQNEIVG